MLSPPTMEQLQTLKLFALAAAWTAQQQDAELSALSFDERFGLLVQAEWLARENTRVTRALQAAKLKLGQACLEGIDYPARRELDKAVADLWNWKDDYVQPMQKVRAARMALTLKSLEI